MATVLPILTSPGVPSSSVEDTGGDVVASGFSDYIVFVDESGDHSLASINPQYPLFVLAFCVFEKERYAAALCPAVSRFKFLHFGHDCVVLHEHEIRKQQPPFEFLREVRHRADFLEGLNRLVTAADCTIVACAIRKRAYASQHAAPTNPYHLGLAFGLERLAGWLNQRGQGTRITHVVAECRGAREDRELALEFRRVCAGWNGLREVLPFQLVMVDKRANQCGLQISDLVARPIGRHVLAPEQPNRAFEIIKQKLALNPEGRPDEWGLKVFP